ncbi:adenosylmethionine--8-amino-7-oxononanoate transaminase [Mesoterricola silvestris]|uniref:Adenosylmethionine-8-amino-7-oxononanoate aminotransferase n=1 Tax=Mesoterricola silvestris TaxID=2927979 RepID=A0AA48GPN7_9BACT|nr:adenosylmethionine--8-amino-7-oxononanoate transaminase [Mesoterricola silvestris]BDU71702.1 adenosylmethionine--8-amino-7-oxononanoate aminotransferase BioA [Mesoterricola silvestris]
MDRTTLMERDRALVWHPFTQAHTAPPPIPVRSARGAVLTDFEGQEILDLISSWWVTLHGHGHPAIARAIGEQALRLEQVIFAGFTHEPAVELCGRITSLLPPGLRRCFFSDNGSTAVEVALKMALQARGNRGEARGRFLAFDGGYHGDTVGAMSVGVSSRFFEAWRAMLFPVDVLPVPATWEGDGDVEAKEAAALAALDRHLDLHGASTAAAVIEPLVQGASGMRMHRPEFLRGAVERLRARGILVILDEVMTGFGRLGPLFGCLGAGVEPDFICLSKGLTGGALPMSLTVTTDAVHDAFLDEDTGRAFLHGHSFTANPLGCAAALASLDLLLDPACAEARSGIEHRHRTDLAGIVEASPNAARMRVRGTLAAFEVLGEDPQLNARMKRHFLRRGLLLRPLGNTVYLMPPYCVTGEQLDRAYAGIEAGLATGFPE